MLTLNFIPLEYKRGHISEGLSSMADDYPFNMGGGPPWNHIPGIRAICPVSPHSQVE